MMMWEYQVVPITSDGECKTGKHKEECDRRHAGGDDCPGYHYWGIYASINDLGKLGWELVTVIRGDDPSDHWTAFFKRHAVV